MLLYDSADLQLAIELQQQEFVQQVLLQSPTTSRSGIVVGPQGSTKEKMSDTDTGQSVTHSVDDSSTSSCHKFSFGNPRIEMIEGSIKLLKDDVSVPESRHTLCLLKVPKSVTYAAFLKACESFIGNIKEMRFLRVDKEVDSYGIFLLFNTKKSADDFCQSIKSNENYANHYFVADAKCTSTYEITPSSDARKCLLCEGDLVQDGKASLTTICNHSFHCSCIPKETCSSCPVCYYILQPIAIPNCMHCGEEAADANVWMCLHCDFVGCHGDHTHEHYASKKHGYFIDPKTQKVWDYAAEAYVHFLIQNEKKCLESINEDFKKSLNLEFTKKTILKNYMAKQNGSQIEEAHIDERQDEELPVELQPDEEIETFENLCALKENLTQQKNDLKKLKQEREGLRQKRESLRKKKDGLDKRNKNLQEMADLRPFLLYPSSIRKDRLAQLLRSFRSS